MRVSAIAVVAVATWVAAVGHTQPQPEAVLTIGGVPGSMTIRIDRTDWTQINGMPDPRTPQISGVGSVLSTRTGSPLTSRGSPSGTDRGKVAMQDFTITKDVDRSTPTLGSLLASGEHIREARLEVRSAGGAREVRLIITMRNAVITRVTEQPAVGMGRPTEAVTFTCESLEWESRPAASAWRASPLPYAVTPTPP